MKEKLIELAYSLALGVLFSFAVGTILLAFMALAISLMTTYTFHPGVFWYFALTVPLGTYLGYKFVKSM